MDKRACFVTYKSNTNTNKSETNRLSYKNIMNWDEFEKVFKYYKLPVA